MGGKQTQREFSSTGPELGLERSQSEHPVRDAHGVIRGDRTSSRFISALSFNDSNYKLTESNAVGRAFPGTHLGQLWLQEMKSASHSNKLTPFCDPLAEKTRSQAAGLLPKNQIGNAKETLSNFKPCHNHFQELLTLMLTAYQSQQTNTTPGSEQDHSGSCSTPKPGLPPRSTDRTSPHNVCCRLVRH